MKIQDQILELPIEELEKMNLLSQLEKNIREKEHWDKKERHFELQKLFWMGTVILLSLHVVISLETSDIKASVAALSFMLTSGAKYNVNGDILSNELQQLGLPKGKIYS